MSMKFDEKQKVDSRKNLRVYLVSMVSLSYDVEKNKNKKFFTKFYTRILTPISIKLPIKK